MTEQNTMSETQTKQPQRGNGSELSGLVILPSEVSIEAWPPQATSGMLTGEISNGVLIHHKPSGVMVTYDKHRSQHKNKEEAWKRLKHIVRALEAI